jgi:acyl carrier protein
VAAANAFLDNLIVWRSALGLPGSNLNWGSPSEAGTSQGPRGIDLVAVLAKPAPERTEAIGEFVRRTIASVLHMDDPDGVDAHAEFVHLGLDSWVAVELKNELESALRVPLPDSLAFDYPSAARLTDFLAQQLVSPEAA